MVKDNLWLRSRIIQAVRDYFQKQGFLETETPLLIPANAPEEYIDPIAVGSGQYLQTSPEICMKRLLCNGRKRIFQICRCWRAGERGTKHLSEFTMLEWYRADSNYYDLMRDCEGLLRHISLCLHESHCYKNKSILIDPRRDWLHLTLNEAFHRFANAELLECIKTGIFEQVLCEQVEPALGEFEVPVFITDFPASLAALARLKDGQSGIAERFELYLGGLELANGFSELNDPDEQRRRFEEANKVRYSLNKDILPMPENFLSELGKMPPSAGIALGIDRLIMLATGAERIDDVVAFTPETL